MQVRLAQERDGEAIRAIYNLEVTTSTVTFDLVPRSEGDQRRWLLDHAGAHAALVAVDDDGGHAPIDVSVARSSPMIARPCTGCLVDRRRGPSIPGGLRMLPKDIA